MSRWIILLRAVTPTGRNKVPMAALREALESAGLRQVATLINTGNVVASSRLGQVKVERMVHEIILDRFGGDLVVMARTPAYVRAALQRNPFQGAAVEQLYFSLLASPPDDDAVSALMATDFTPDRIAVIDDIAYVHCVSEPARSKLTTVHLERRLKRAATTRIHHTLARLLAMADD